MTYVQITRSPGVGLEQYERVQRELGPEPLAGHVSSRVGIIDGVLVTVDEWESRADADRFAAERLFPAFERAAVPAGATTEVTAFEDLTAGAVR
ncbi:hypothetical protein GCM10009836_60270 [Pseudonocardia ailaonensis]|uniref:ABM domain-containing protein n=2 Tax=Pseudonocardia ailaonensis TaxID=367279 RepID=A0ABN2NJ03_9PSEU